MAFGARRTDRGWQLCLRKGATVELMGGEPLVFPSQKKAKACADALNSSYWRIWHKNHPHLAGELQSNIRALVEEFLP